MGRKKNEETNVTDNRAQGLVRGVTYDPEPVVEETNDFYDETKSQFILEGLASLSKETKQSMASVSDKEIRLIIDNYYQTQAHRMNIANQIRAVIQEFDHVQEGEQPAI